MRPARSRPQHRVAVPRRGALKHRPPAEPTKAVGTAEQITGFRMLPALFCKRRAATKRRCKLGGGRHRLTFQPQIHVTEFKRVLDGGATVPGDGTHITLGLGRPLRSQTVPLAPPRLADQPPQVPIEESAWVQPKQRERLLRRAMGDGRYFRAWSRRRIEVRRIKASRQESNSTAVDQELMPTSFQEAWMRAEALAHEVQQQQHRQHQQHQQQQHTPSALQDTGMHRLTRGRKRRRPASLRGQQHGKKKSLVADVAAAEVVSGGRQLGAEAPTTIAAAAAKPFATAMDAAAAFLDAAAASIEPTLLVHVCKYCQNTLPAVPGAKAADATTKLLHCPSCAVSGAIRASAAAGA